MGANYISRIASTALVALGTVASQVEGQNRPAARAQEPLGVMVEYRNGKPVDTLTLARDTLVVNRPQPNYVAQCQTFRPARVTTRGLTFADTAYTTAKDSANTQLNSVLRKNTPDRAYTLSAEQLVELNNSLRAPQSGHRYGTMTMRVREANVTRLVTRRLVYRLSSDTLTACVKPNPDSVRQANEQALALAQAVAEPVAVRPRQPLADTTAKAAQQDSTKTVADTTRPDSTNRAADSTGLATGLIMGGGVDFSSEHDKMGKSFILLVRQPLISNIFVDVEVSGSQRPRELNGIVLAAARIPITKRFDLLVGGTYSGDTYTSTGPRIGVSAQTGPLETTASIERPYIIDKHGLPKDLLAERNPQNAVRLQLRKPGFEGPLDFSLASILLIGGHRAPGKRTIDHEVEARTVYNSPWNKRLPLFGRVGFGAYLEGEIGKGPKTNDPDLSSEGKKRLAAGLTLHF